jgi:hypothetical protein
MQYKQIYGWCILIYIFIVIFPLDMAVFRYFYEV